MRPGRFRRAVRGAAASLGSLVAFAAAVLGGVLLHLDLPAARRVAAQVVNTALAPVFQGRIVVESIDRVSLRGVEVASASIYDPRGAPVIRASRVQARADFVALAREAVLGDGPLRIALDFVRIEHADVVIETGPFGLPTIGEAFVPRTAAKPPSRPTKPSRPARQVELEMAHIEIGHAWAHGLVAPPRRLDADVTRLAASLLVNADGLALEVQRAGVIDRAIMPAVADGAGTYHLRVAPPAASGGLPDVRMGATFAGQLGRVEVLATMALENGKLSAAADVPRASPAELRGLVPELPLRTPVRAHLSLQGEPPRFEVAARVTTLDPVGPTGVVTAEGELDASGPVRLFLDVTAQDLNPRALVATAPRGRVGGSALVRVELGEGPPRVVVEARTQPAVMAGHVVPPADLSLSFERGVLSGGVALYEPGATTSGTFTLLPSEEVRFDARAEIPSIRRAPRLRAPLDGAADVHVAGVLRGDRLDAAVDATVTGLRVPGALAVGHARVRGRLEGPLDALLVRADATASRLTAGSFEVSRLRASASGPVAAPFVRATLTDEDGGALTASGRLEPARRAVASLRLRFQRDGDVVEGEVARASIERGGAALRELRLSGDGMGRLSGSLAVAANDVTGTLRGEDVDIGRVAKLLGFPLRVKAVANVDVALERGKAGRSGHVHLELEDGEVTFLRGLSAHVTAEIEHDEVTLGGFLRLVARDPEGTQEACEGTIAQIQVSGAKGTLAGPLLEAGTWAGATGRASVAADDWDLRCIERLVPFGLPVGGVRGRLTTRFEVERKPNQRFPSLRDLLVRTRRLEVAAPLGLGDETPAWESRSVDVQVKGSLDGESGALGARATLLDGQLLADVSLDAKLDLPVLADHPERRASSLRGSPMSARVSVPRRSLSSFSTLPTFVRAHIPPIQGELRFDAYADGTLERPFAAAHVQAFGLAHGVAGAAQPSPWALPVDLDTTATYEDGRATLDAEVARGGRTIATATAEVATDLGRLLTGAAAPGPRWKGGFLVKLTDVPVGEIPSLADAGIGGQLNGTVAMIDLNEAPRLSAKLEIPYLQVGTDAHFERAEASLDIRPQDGPGTDMAIARVGLVGHEAGSRLEGTAYAGVAWKEGLVPTIAMDRPADLYADVRRLRLAVLQPLVAGVLSKLDGYLDGGVRVGWRRLSEEDRGSINADLRLTDGAVHVPQIGQELRNAKAHIVAKGAGAARTGEAKKEDASDFGTIDVQDLTAEGVSGRVAGWALATLRGLRFVGAAGELRIARGEELPVTLEGAPIGKAWGTVAFKAEQRERELDVQLEMKALHLELPASTSRSVTLLEDHPDVRVTHALGPKKERRPEDAMRYALTFTFGDVTVERADLNATLETTKEAPLRVELSDKPRVRGDIKVNKGFLELFGKKFEVERGLVRMRAEDTSNPYVNVRAHWDAPDGTRVFVDYIGLLKPPTKEKLRLSSTGGHTEQAILSALLLGGDLEQAEQPSAGQAAGNVAVGVGGGLAAEQFNQVLSGITPLRGLSTQFGTSEEGNLRTSVAYDLGDTLTAQATFERGDSPQTAPAAEPEGDAQQATTQAGSAVTPSRTELSIDWRFHRNWVLRGKVGVAADSRSSGLELIWQYRY